MKTVTVENYREDKYYSRVVRAVAKILSRSNMVAPVDVLLEMGNLKKDSVLHFTKSGIKRLYKAYCRHYVWNQSQDKKQLIVDQVIAEHEA